MDETEAEGCRSRARPVDRADFTASLHQTLMFEDADDIVIPGFSGAELRAEDFPEQLPKPQPKRPHTPHVTVHQYTCGSQLSLRSSPLAVGRRVAEMATTTSGWRTVNPPDLECTSPFQHTPSSPSSTNRSNSVICRDDRSFIYAPPVPVLSSEASLVREKEWGVPPSSDEIFSTADLDEFVGTDFSCLHFPTRFDRYPEAHAASQYDPYAEAHISGVQSIPHVPFALLGSVAHGPEYAGSLGPSVIPGLAVGTPWMGSDAELYEESHPKLATGLRFERDHPRGNSDADLYGSAPQNLSPPRGSGGSKSPQVDVHHKREQIRKFDTSTLLHAIPEVRSHPAICVQWAEAGGFIASFLPCAVCGSFYCSPIAHSAFQ